MEESQQEYKEMQGKAKRELSKAKQRLYDELGERLDNKEGEKNLYQLVRQKDRAGNDVQQVGQD